MPLKTLTVNEPPERAKTFRDNKHGPRMVQHRSPGTFRTAMRRAVPLTITMQEDNTAIDENGFYQSLHRHSVLYRVVLKRPFFYRIPIGEWYRFDLELVNELGLSLKGDRERLCYMRLSCELLVKEENQDGMQIATDYQIETRPLQLNAWDFLPGSSSAPESPGFNHSGVGGIEFRLLEVEGGEWQRTAKTKCSKKYYIRILPTFDSDQTLHALPLTCGPLEVVGGDDAATEANKLEWAASDVRSESMQRAFSLDRLSVCGTEASSGLPTPPGLFEKLFVVKEGWTLGTPGKMWDSALILSDMFAKKIMRQPNCLEGRHIIDMSAGTGCVGLLVGFLCRHLNPGYKTRITLTDLPDALDLINQNHKLNLGSNGDKNIRIEKLAWGNAKDAKRVLKGGGPADIIVASDVLYDPEYFALLVHSLRWLSTPGKTVIYLGYKRRGLKEEEEKTFFDMINASFHMTVVQDNPNTNDDPVDWEMTHGYLTRNHGDLDGRGWLGKYAMDKPEAFAFGSKKEAGVQVYRLVLKKRT